MVENRAAQVWLHHPAFRRPRHFHEEPELNLVLRGRATIAIGKEALDVGSGALVYFHAGQDHELVSASDGLELFVLALRPELAARIDPGSSMAGSGSVQLSADELRRVAEQLSATALLSDRVAVERSLVNVFETAAPRFRGVHPLSRRAVRELVREPGVSAGDLARRFRVNQSDVSRAFSRDLAVHLVDFRARLRLMHFIRFVDVGLSLSQAALAAHFGSYAQCHRVFKRHLRCAPQDYFAGTRSQVDAALEPDFASGAEP
jgi:AraC-like DNA-binding protein